MMKNFIQDSILSSSTYFLDVLSLHDFLSQLILHRKPILSPTLFFLFVSPYFCASMCLIRISTALL